MQTQKLASTCHCSVILTKDNFDSKVHTSYNNPIKGEGDILLKWNEYQFFKRCCIPGGTNEFLSVFTFQI